MVLPRRLPHTFDKLLTCSGFLHLLLWAAAGPTFLFSHTVFLSRRDSSPTGVAFPHACSSLLYISSSLCSCFCRLLPALRLPILMNRVLIRRLGWAHFGGLLGLWRDSMADSLLLLWHHSSSWYFGDANPSGRTLGTPHHRWLR